MHGEAWAPQEVIHYNVGGDLQVPAHPAALFLLYSARRGTIEGQAAYSNERGPLLRSLSPFSRAHKDDVNIVKEAHNAEIFGFVNSLRQSWSCLNGS